MNTLQSPAPSRDPRDSTEATTEESLAAHAKRVLLARVRARLTAILDAGIALLQRLRKKAGGEPDAAEDEDRPRSRNDRSRERPGSVAPPVEAVAPRPKRRLRAFLIYVGLMLVGGLGGGALAYTQFQKQLDRQLAASRSLEAAHAKKTRPSAATLKAFEDALVRRDNLERKLASAFAEFSESTDTSHALFKNMLGQQFAENRRLEAALAENVKSSAETRQALEKEQAERSAAEGKLASSLAEHAKSAAEKQQQLDTAEKQLAMLLDSVVPRSIQREAPVSRHHAGSRIRPPKTGNCTLNAQNVDDLKGCLEDFNR